MRASHIRNQRSPATHRLAQRVAAAAAVACTLTLARAVTAHADSLVVVGPGDTLSAIAAAHDTTVESIVARNGLASADVIFSGQRLLVPDGMAEDGMSGDDREPEPIVDLDAAAERPSAAAAAPVPTDRTGAATNEAADPLVDTADAQVDAVWHVAAPGDTLFTIAMTHGTTVQAIARANGIGPAGFIRVGRRLVVPGATRGIGRGASGNDGAATSGNPDEAAGEDANGSDDAARGVGASGVDTESEASAGIAASPGGVRRIVIDLSDQTVSALAGGRLVNRFIASTGSAWTPTPVGEFAVYARLDRQRMTGPGYDLPNVPFVQYFTGSYAIHGAYWHQNFGVPVSHGCVNLQPGDAAWLYDWADYGTPVIVQR